MMKNWFPPKARQRAHLRLLQDGHFARCVFCHRNLGTRASSDQFITSAVARGVARATATTWYAQGDRIEANGYCTSCQPYAPKP